MKASATIIIGVFVWEVIVILLFLMFNTVIIGETVGVFDDIANTSGFVDYSQYTQRSGMIQNSFYGMFGIMIVAPILYLIVRLYFKREADPYQAYGGYA